MSFPGTLPRAVLLSAALSVLAGTAPAQRLSTRDMRCAEALDLVRSRGAVVMSTGEHTFDRFVDNPAYCVFGEQAFSGWAPTRDVLRCAVGFICKPATRHSRSD